MRRYVASIPTARFFYKEKKDKIKKKEDLTQVWII